MLGYFYAGRSFQVVKQSESLTRRCISSQATRFLDYSSRPSSKYQLYVSNNNDPVFNLSVEHHLLQSTHEASTILFLYVNRPCIVIGRNQNPWLETNLSALWRAEELLTHATRREWPPNDLEIIRRRSGGGTVFHDYGNANFSVICPPRSFTRDKHAEMVVRAIRYDNARARVNERHDIVLDTGSLLPQDQQPLGDDTHRSSYERDLPLKVSGSAYKLTRTRALHHGTCLVNSENVGNISTLLRSPLAPFIKARGVDSVKSAVGNVFSKGDSDAVQKIQKNVIEQFCQMYAIDATISLRLLTPGLTTVTHTFEEGVCGVLGEDLKEVDKIQSGMQEMSSIDWLYGQTPQFTFSTFSTSEDSRPRPPLPAPIPPSTKVCFTARGGRINSAQLSISPSVILASDPVVGQELHRLEGWTKLLRIDETLSENANRYESEVLALGDWLDKRFGLGTNKGGGKLISCRAGTTQ